MGMGIPVLHGVEGESADIVTRTDIGLTFEPENAEMLVERLVLLHDNTSLREKFGRNGPKAAIQFDRSALARSMLAILDRTVSR